MIYTFDLLGGDARAYDLQVGVFADDQAATGAARSLLQAHKRAAAIEVWDLDRRIARVAASERVPNVHAS